MYTTHVFKNQQYLQLILCLLPNKTAEFYKNMWIRREMCKTDLVPKLILLGFEHAVHHEIKHVFPHTEARGGKFHLGQSWYQKIGSLGLQSRYKNKESKVGIGLKLFICLPFLPHHEEPDAFCNLLNVKSQQQKKCFF